MEGGYTFGTSRGKWIISSSATRTRRYDLQLTSLTPTEDRLSHLNEAAWAPEMEGASLQRISLAGLSGSVTGRYLGEYSDVAPSVRTLGDYWYIDASFSADLKQVFPALPTRPDSAGLTLSVANLTDRQPEYANTSYFYDTTQADVRGRYFSLQLTLGW